ncbi:MAG: DUF4157 domain-containing protein [Ardenticatenaceae bacterium]|nr:DUF4157 domain-containing protein [Anaerolineales bacterium]MCB8919550.1 DUF4157 domain-containing protein [Ardenticatenaceae bacterium]
MTNEFTLEDKGKVRSKPAQESAAPQKSDPPLTLARIQGKWDPPTVSQMQRTMGNAAVQRLLAQRSEEGAAEVDDDVANTISSQRGSGASLDQDVAAKAGSVMGQDFSGVKVHTDSTADQLNRELNAKAFTTGSDIFFRAGEYQPGSSAGQHLLSHELTHVVQQGASAPAVQGKMTVNDPNDQYEAEADRVADMVMSQPATQRQEDEEELQMKPVDVQRQEDEEELQMKPMDVQRQEDEEELQMKPMDVQRQEDEEVM